ncbi:MAG: hypothetical protein ACE5LQ_02605, partial [Candidatus Bipolaricaulia bacterium]
MWWSILGGILAGLLGYGLGRLHLARQLAREERRAAEIVTAAREEAERLRQEALLAGQEEL